MVTKLLRTAGLAGRNSLILLTISLFVATPLQTFLLGSLASADPTGWLAAGDPEIKFSELPSGYTIPYSYNYNTDCDTTNFNVITREAKSGQAELRHNSSCAVRTVRGMSDGEYLDSGLPAGKFAGMSGSVVRIPNSKTLMSNRTVINSISVEAAFYDAIVPSYNLTTGEATFNLVGHKFLSDQANNKYYLRPGSSGFSLDGQWMVAESDRGFIRVNLTTREVIPFASRVKNDNGAGPDQYVAISSGGKYAAISTSSGSFKVYDIETCAPVPAAPTGPVACQSKDIQPFLASKFNGYKTSVYIRFSSPEFLSFISAYTDQSGANKRAAVRMTPSGQTIEDISYLALGDSFSSGEGAYEYEPGTDSTNPKNKCHLSRNSYPYLTAEMLGINSFHSVACSGAKFHPHYGGFAQYDYHADVPPPNIWTPGLKTQQQYILEAGDPSVVTISMIGNDIGFKDKLQKCISGLDSCFHFREDRQSVAEEIRKKFDTLVNLYNDIKSKAPNSKVYVLGYPQIFGTGASCKPNVLLDAEEREFARGLAVYLNSVIRAATEKSGVKFIDTESTFEGKQHCDNASELAVNGVTAGNDFVINNLGPLGNESFHPNKLGHNLMSQALIAQSVNFSSPMPSPTNATAPGAGSNPYNILLGNAPSGGTFSRATYTSLETLEVVYKGNPFPVSPTETPFRPNSPFDFVFNSEPTYAGTLTSDAQGQLSGEIVVPASIIPGYHTLHIYGQNLSGENIDLYKTIYVAENETDFDGDGIAYEEEKCVAVESANVDEDWDGIDDACDGEISEVPADTTSPLVTGSPDRQPDYGEWYNSDVTIDWSATDLEPSSGTPTQPPATLADQEGIVTYTSDESCDPLGNCAAGNVSIKLDKTPPEISFSLAPAPNTSGWNNGAVTVTFNCDDAISGVSECSDPVALDNGDGGYTVTGTSNDNAGNASSVNVIVSIDRTKPVISNKISPAANLDGWHNTDVTIAPACSDNLSGIFECSAPAIFSSDGADQTFVSSATDNAGNVAIASSSVSIDKTAPTLGSPSWSANPKSVTEDATLTIPAADILSGITEAEYFLGDTDPGQGNGATMTLNEDSLSTTFGADFPTGVYKVTVRAKDRAGNWSAPVSDYLVVYNPDGVRMTGRRTVLPSLVNGDVLPGLTANNQTDIAKFGFNVRYDNQGQIHHHSDFQFSYKTGTKCHRPAEAQNCHSFNLNANTIAWLTTQGTNDSTGIFQGTATLEIDGISNQVNFRLTGLDGERLDSFGDDHLTLLIYDSDENPNTASPTYRATGEVVRGNIRIRTQ